MIDERFKVLGNRLKRVMEGFSIMKNLGIDEEILIAWLQVKTKLSAKVVRIMLRSQEEFYERLMREEMLKKIKSGNT